MTLHIDGPESGRLSKVIETAYPAINNLQLALSAKLNDSIFNYAGFGAQYPEIRFNLIQQYNARYHIDKLVSALLEDRSDCGPLADFALRHDIPFSPPGADVELTTSTKGGLERMFDPVRGFQDVTLLLGQLSSIVNAVCQITVPVAGGLEYGTGFLIGNETLLTNWHVVEHVTEGNRGDMRLLFDFRSGRDGKTQAGGTEYRLVAGEWLVDHSPYHADDLAAQPLAPRLASTRPEDSLDYAVLRIDGSPGTKLVAGRARGFLPLSAASTEAVDFDPATAAMFIFQHPYDPTAKKVLPLQLDWEKPAIRGLNANGTRVIYDVNTCPGSSGSPCFNARLELIALHHAGAKDWPAIPQYLYNQGIPIGRIRDLITKHGNLHQVI